ncbi:MAG: hypothetical protein EOM73_09205 [Bacteroidia bacterium]|nr:hypothetical protein [Bacteroidia bacterium]
MKINFAFALNDEKMFEKKHFGEAEHYAIYSYEKGKLILIETLPNSFISLDEGKVHGSKEKGLAIISFLKEKEVMVLVSKQFGKNIKMVSQHFIPVIIDEDQPEQVVEIIVRNIKWIKDELKNRNTGYMLFRIKTGILKTVVE